MDAVPVIAASIRTGTRSGDSLACSMQRDSRQALFLDNRPEQGITLGGDGPEEGASPATCSRRDGRRRAPWLREIPRLVSPHILVRTTVPTALCGEGDVVRSSFRSRCHFPALGDTKAVGCLVRAGVRRCAAQNAGRIILRLIISAQSAGMRS